LDISNTKRTEKNKKKVESKMNTTTAIIITQIPIALGILIGAFEVYRTKKLLIEILDKLAEDSNLKRKEKIKK
jgi:hypothetical protein